MMENDNVPLERDDPTEIAALRKLASALADSAQAYESAAREGDETFRPFFLTLAKERTEMVNELHARILALGGQIESETDLPHRFASAINKLLPGHHGILTCIDENETTLRSLFLTTIDQQHGDTQTLLRTHLFALERTDKEMHGFSQAE